MSTRRYFVVRPFGTKAGIDFENVERQLIAPACELAGFAGGTTMQFIEQGNIRTDMFRELLIADLVVADISIQNANVFYELGIRHALRDKRTFLIRSKGDTVPFDLKTDRYFSYDAQEPAASLNGLAAALRETRRSDKQDSPVFQLLPALEPADAESLQVVPLSFQESVEQAEREDDEERLRQMVELTDGEAWGIPGLRLLGRAQRRTGDFRGAAITWEIVREFDPMDVEANIELGTILHKCGDTVRSGQALQRALKDPELGNYQRAETMALLGRNAKAQWEADWANVEPLQERQRLALASGHLENSFKWYRRGYREDRNHYYSGLNALAMVTILTELAELLPDDWEDGYDSPERAALALADLKARRVELAAGVKLALESKQALLDRNNESDIWTDISNADLTCLTCTRPRRVGRAYQVALRNAQDFEIESAANQLNLYRRLALLADNVDAALKIISVPGNA